MLNIEADELRRLYWDKKLSTYKIAKRFNVCSETIRKKLKRFGIPLRERHQAQLIAIRNRNGNTEKQEEDFCKGCQRWILWTVTSMGMKIYKCKLKRRPEVKKGKLFCPYRKE